MLRGIGFFVQPIETGCITDGVPDLFYTSSKADTRGWLELKHLREIPKKPMTSLFKSANHPLGIYQANWINRCIECGTKANILVAYERRYFFVPGEYADTFNGFTWEVLQTFEVKKEDIWRKL